MWMHDNGEILIPVLNNNTNPRGPPQMSFSHFLARRRQEGVLEDERGAEGKGRGGVMCCWVESWTLKWQTEGINERWQTAIVVPGGRRGNSAPLIMKWPSLRKLLLRPSSGTFPTMALRETEHRVRKTKDPFSI